MLGQTEMRGYAGSHRRHEGIRQEENIRTILTREAYPCAVQSGWAASNLKRAGKVSIAKRAANKNTSVGTLHMFLCTPENWQSQTGAMW